MSTDRKKKRRSLRVERIKIIEYGLIALVVLVFVGLAVFYGLRDKNGDAAPDPEPSPAAPTPEPTEDPSIRGMNVWKALEDSGYTIRQESTEQSVITSPDGVEFTMLMESKDGAIQTLSFETVLCPDSDEDAAFARILNEKNHQSVEAIRSLFDCIMPVFHRSGADSDKIASECQKVVKSGTPYSKNLSGYFIRIESDPNAALQTVLITLKRTGK